MYNLKPLSPLEMERIVELDFYFLITHLLKKYKYTSQAYDVIDMFTDIFGCDFSLIRLQVQAIHRQTGVLRPTKYESSVMLYRQDYPVRSIVKGIRVHNSTIYKNIRRFIKEDQPEFKRKTDDETFDEIVKFMTQFNELVTGWHPCV